MFKFWLVTNDTVEEPITSITHPTDESIVRELLSYGIRTFIYRSSEWYNVAHSFGVYVSGKIFRQDLAKFQQGLTTFWNGACSGCFVKFMIPEMYFVPLT